MTTFSARTIASTDDADIADDGTTGYNDTRANVIAISDATAATRRNAGFRIHAVTIPNAATIDACDWTINIPSATNDDIDVEQKFTAEDDAATWSSGSAPYDGHRAFTVSGGTWSATAIGAISTTGPDCKAALQAVVDRAGWASGQDVAGVFEGNTGTSRQINFRSWDGDSATSPLLTADYTAAGGARQLLTLGVG